MSNVIVIEVESIAERHPASSSAFKKITSVRRRVLIDGEIVYRDEMSIEIYSAINNPTQKLLDLLNGVVKKKQPKTKAEIISDCFSQMRHESYVSLNERY